MPHCLATLSCLISHPDPVSRPRLLQDDNAGPRSPLIAPPEFLPSSGSADRGPETTGARENESEDMHVGNGRAEMGNGLLNEDTLPRRLSVRHSGP